jgi:Holliday junction resolvasome RuvABC DNA-binding subunit
MDTLKKKIIDLTNQIEYEVDLTEEEIIDLETRLQENTAILAAEEQARQEAEAKAALKVAALAKLGLTEEEINAFLA